MTTNFYAPPENVRGDRVVLPEDEARHASRVLRTEIGDEIVVVDGAGGWYRVAVDHVDRRSLHGRILERRTAVGELPYDLILGFGMIKHRARFETLLEKVVELGVSVMVPLVTERTEKQRFREERSENILIAAMKQCGRSRMPALLEPISLDEFLADAQSRWAADVRMMCHEQAPANYGIFEVLAEDTISRTIVVTVGPEGGFTDDELLRASSAGFKTVSLGERRLRAETAGIAAAAAVMLACERIRASDTRDIPKPTFRHE